MFGVQWMVWNFTSNKHCYQKYRSDTIDGKPIILWVWKYVFAPMEPFQLLLKMFLALSMTVKLQTGQMFMLSWKKFTTTMVAFVLLILHFIKLRGPIKLIHVRIHVHKKHQFRNSWQDTHEPRCCLHASISWVGYEISAIVISLD